LHGVYATGAQIDAQFPRAALMLLAWFHQLTRLPMHNVSDVLFWRSLFLLVMIAAFIAGLVGWRIAVWVGERVRASGARKALASAAAALSQPRHT